MFDYIEGELAAKSPTSAVIEANGVGYRFQVPLSTSRRLPEKGRARLLVHFYVREDIQRLYGFATEGERRVFERLMSVPKVGPAVALAVLSGLSLAELRDAVSDQRPELLRRVKGVGTATAERIVRELRRVLPDLIAEIAPEEISPVSGKKTDAVSALMALGYQRSSAERAAMRAVDKAGDQASLEELVTEALRQI